MPRKFTTYEVSEIPDPNFTRYQLAAGGDVHQAIWTGWESVIRAVSQFPAGALSLSLKGIFTPQPSPAEPQARLRFLISAEAEDQDVLEEMGLLIEHGPLANYYGFRPVENRPVEESGNNNTCTVVRRVDLLKPLHDKQFNDRIPDWYYLIHSFEPRTNNDYLPLDKVLNKIRQRVTIVLGVEPADLSSELRAHTRYLASLQSINRTWDQDDFPYDWPSTHIVSRKGADTFSGRPREIKPLRKNDPLADTVLRSQQKIHESLSKPHLSFSIQVQAGSSAIAHLVTTMLAESAFDKGSYQILKNSEEHLPPEYKAFERMARAATVEELMGAFRLPVASYGSPLCIRKNTDPLPQPAEERLILGFDQELLCACEVAGGASPALGPRLIELAKHGFLCGVPGSGKTTAAMNIVLQLHAHQIPVLIIEPVKTEYRLLKTLHDCTDPTARHLAETMEIYTPGNESISPFRLNCLESFGEIGVEEHIGNLLSCFMGAMPSTPFLPMIIEEALERAYEGHDLVNSPPLMEDLVDVVSQVISEKGYSGDTLSDILAASELRLASLTRGVVGRVLQCRRSVPSIERLTNRTSLIELDHLSSEKASLLTMFLLMAIRERFLSIPKTGKGLRLVIILEEAHSLVGRTGPAQVSEEAPNPKAFVAEAICRMLVEFRALEVGVIVVDQHSTAVAAEVIKATGSKIAFRQVADEDRKDLGATMLFGPLEMEENARLGTGEAYLFTEGMYGPRRIQTINLHDQYDLSADVVRGSILPYMRSDSWLLEVAVERAAQELSQLKEALDRYDDRWLGFVGRLGRLLAANARLTSTEHASPIRDFRALRQGAVDLKKAMSVLFRSFSKGPYRRLLKEANPKGLEQPAVAVFREALIDRFEKVIVPGFLEGTRQVDQLIDHTLKIERNG